MNHDIVLKQLYFLSFVHIFGLLTPTLLTEIFEFSPAHALDGLTIKPKVCLCPDGGKGSVLQ